MHNRLLPGITITGAKNKVPGLLRARNNFCNFKILNLITYSNMMRTIPVTLAFLLSFIHSIAQDKKAKLEIAHLTGDFYIYTTYNTYKEYQVPANGMYLLTDQGVVMFDTPWDTTQFQPLLDSIQVKHHKNVILCFATHWHSDKTAGLEYYRQQGIKTYTTVLTDELSKKNSKKRAAYLMTKDTVFTVGPYTFETYFPGEGHTVDNIVIWFKKEKILYGGCLIKGADAEDLGYLDDGNKAAYEATLKNVRNKFRKPNYIIIAHSDWNNINSLKHSIRMARKLKKENSR
jgi:metallo-beta-lactamase class B